MANAGESASRIIDDLALRTMIELGKFCGSAASETSNEAIHAAFQKFVASVEANFKRVEDAMVSGGIPSPLHTTLHGHITHELNDLGDTLSGKGVTLEKEQLLRLRRMVVAGGELDGILAEHLRRQS